MLQKDSIKLLPTRRSNRIRKYVSYKKNTVTLKKAGNNLKAVGSSDVTEEPSKVSASDVTLCKCSACGKFFGDKDGLRSHVRSCHSYTYVSFL